MADMEVGVGGHPFSDAGSSTVSGTHAVSDTAADVGVRAAKKTAGVKVWSKSRVVNTLRVINMFNGLLLVLTGILIFITGAMSVTFTSVTVAAYIVFFGLMMACLECNIGNVAPKFRENCGFMFSFAGRTIFILFCATLLFALNYIAGWIVGAFTALNGLFNGYVICVHPAFRSGELKAGSDPYGGYTGGESEMMDYLKRNPAVAQRATTAITDFAKAHPEQAMKVATAVASSSAAAAHPPASAAARDPNENPFAP